MIHEILILDLERLAEYIHGRGETILWGRMMTEWRIRTADPEAAATHVSQRDLLLGGRMRSAKTPAI